VSSTEISYRIDRENRLVDVGGDWDAFALENETPALRRFMEMDIASPDGAAVEYRCRVLRTEPRPPVYTVTAEAGGERTMRMCSWCKKVHLTRDLWVEVEEAIARFGLLEDEAPPQITHGMCDACLEKLYGEDK
jgi:hypothetical protein